MKIDKQTLAWFNKSKKWMRLLKPSYIGGVGGIAENAALPNTMHPTFSIYTDPFTGEKKTVIGDVWGFEKWHHSFQLRGNQCSCPRCNFDGKNDDWWYYPMVVNE